MQRNTESGLREAYFKAPQAAHGRALHAPHYGERYLIGRRVFQEVISAHQPGPGEPLTRPLKIFSIDPAASKLEGKVAIAHVPYEPLQPGPRGALVEVVNVDGESGQAYPDVDLDEHVLLLSQGVSPSESDRRFHAQMVYAVASIVHSCFRRALGREIGWPFPPYKNSDGKAVSRLRLHPFAGEIQNSCYDPNLGSMQFGYFFASARPADSTLPKSIVYTALSHDAVAFEMSHAMLDALRTHLVMQTGHDVAGFQTGFADLVALFLHFRYREALRVAIVRSRGNLRESEYLTSIGLQFGKSSGTGALRDVLAAPEDLSYRSNLDAHEMGRLLATAVFDAFTTVFARKTERYCRLATGGTGRYADGALPDLLVDVLTDKASRLADQFLTMLIRAIDYLPPVNVHLGEFLRAVITSDTELVPNDVWGYREALIDAFRQRSIYPRDVPSLNEDSLIWQAPALALPAVESLSFREMRFNGDPGSPVTVNEQIIQACALGEYVTESPDRMRAFGISPPDDPARDNHKVSLPTVESVRTMRRTSPDGRVVFDTVAEVLQSRSIQRNQSGVYTEVFNGCAIVLDSKGNVRYVVPKRLSEELAPGA